MGWLIGRMLFCLLLAFGLGLLLGWLLGRLGWRQRVTEVEESARRRRKALEADLADCEQQRGESAAILAERDALAERLAAQAEELEALRGRSADEEALAEPMKTPTQALHAVSRESLAGGASDDLKRVEGIGPKIEELLHADGIRTWAALADSDVERLREILRAAGPRYRIHDPGTWPRQARLAAEGRWEELAELQSILDGGRSPES